MCSGDPKIKGFVIQNRLYIQAVLQVPPKSVGAKENPTRAILGRVGRQDLL